MWDASVRCRRYPKSWVPSLLPHGQAVNPYLSLGSGAGYISMRLALTSGVMAQQLTTTQWSTRLRRPSATRLPTFLNHL
eukprot:7641434-Pyramimonas_sp.AAC.1